MNTVNIVRGGFILSATALLGTTMLVLGVTPYRIIITVAVIGLACASEVYHKQRGALLLVAIGLALLGVETPR